MTCNRTRRPVASTFAVAASLLAGGALATPALAADPASAAAATVAIDEVVVIGARENLLKIPGSGATIEAKELERARVFTVNEALRQAPGVFPRDEEGLGLRPNIGVRGLSPVRSTKVLLLEDGVPLAYAPYGDNASYYHPPIRRFARIEILKGASQIRFGPNTVGGVVNYITPSAPSVPEGRITLAGGNRGYFEIDATGGGEIFGARALVHANRTESDGSRDNQALRLTDVYAKIERDIGANHALTLRVSRFTEDSDVTYSGLTQAEFMANPRSNPFVNDTFVTERWGASASHGWRLGEAATLTTTAYYSWFDRDWWRQSSNSAQRPNDASDPACGGMANLSTTCGNEGRLREYNTYGAETRLAITHALFGAEATSEIGARWHTERQNRLQINADTPRGRTPGTSVNAGVRENNLRYADALSAFATTTLDFGRFAVAPGVRVEAIEYERQNRLTGQSGGQDLEEVIPGLGATLELRESLVAYAGVHRGFAPPRVEDIISNAGGAVDLEAEKSWSYEVGLRGDVRPGLSFDATLYRMDFENQIVPASVAGGVGAALTSAGETRHTGLELSARGSLKDMGLLGNGDDLFFRASLTTAWEAEFVGRRLSSISGFGATSVSGNRLPYAPETLFSAALGYAWGESVSTQVEVVHNGEMFADDLNTSAPTANGQRGLIPDWTIWNATANWTPAGGPFTLYATVKNIGDELTIVDRARGVLPGAPRMVQAGVSVAF